MVAVVCRPAESQLGKVACSDNDAPCHIGNVHNHLCALTGLSVFVGYIVNVLALTDVLKMLADGGGNVYLTDRCAICLSKDKSVALSTLCCAEAGHCYGDYALSVKGEHIKGVNGDDKGEGGVKTARKTDNGGLSVDVSQTCGKTCCLHSEYLLAACGKVISVGGHEGHGGKMPAKLYIRDFQLEISFISRIFGMRICGHSAALC